MKPLAYERRILMLALLAGLAGTVVALLLLWLGNFSSKLQWTLTVVILISWFAFAASARQRVRASRCAPSRGSPAATDSCSQLGARTSARNIPASR